MMRIARALAVVLPTLVGASPHGSTTQLATLPPVDEASRDSSLAAFRTDLLNALESTDTTYLLSIVSRDVGNGFGGDAGIRDFRILWFSGSGPYPKLEALRRDLTIGGALVDDSTFRVPYYGYGARWPTGFDAHSHALVLGQRVRVREAPSLASRAVATLTYAVVSLPLGQRGHVDTSGQPGLVWLQIAWGEGTTGFVAEPYLRSPLGFRVTFRKRGGHWLLRSWAEGD